MPWGRRVVGMMVALVTLVPLAAAPAGADRPRSVDVIVVLDDAANPSEVARDHRVYPRHIYEHALTGFAASVPEGRLRGLQNDARVAYVDEDRPVTALGQTTPAGVARIDAPAVHGSTTGAGVRVAIIDTGIESDHPDLENNLDGDSDYDCINSDAMPQDDNGHGTHVAGTVAAANDTSGVVGVAPAAELVAFKVLDAEGSGSWSDVACGVDKAAALNLDSDPGNDIDIANMSLGGSGSAGEDCGSSSLRQAICNAVDVGIAFTVAAGNDSQDASGFVPAAYPEVITVSALHDTNGSETDAGCTGRGWWKVCDETFASFSNYGEIVDVMAPGVDILSTTLGGGTGQKSGTSMAAPHVAGLAALVLEKDPSVGPAALEAHLRTTGQCPDALQNTGSEDCTNQGAWDGDTDSWTEPLGSATGATDTLTGDANTAPVANFTFDCPDLTCTFTDASSDSDDGSIVGWSWDFGDGDSSTAQNPEHTYASGSTYTVTLTVTDDEGATDSASQDVTVSSSTENSAPSADFTASCPDLTCSFTDASSDTDGSVASWRWDFGDGNTSTAQNPKHAYDSGGTYTVTLAVTDDDAATDTTSKSVTVSAPADISLEASGYKEKGRHTIDLRWSGATSTDVNVYRDSSLLTTTGNDGAYTDKTGNVGGGQYTYEVCEAGTDTCSDPVTVTF